jgi:hypothetical protein
MLFPTSCHRRAYWEVTRAQIRQDYGVKILLRLTYTALIYGSGERDLISIPRLKLPSHFQIAEEME